MTKKLVCDEKTENTETPSERLEIPKVMGMTCGGEG